MTQEVFKIETYYLIDYENVHGDGFMGCRNLGPSDHIIIFFTQNARSIDMSVISNHGAAELQMIEVSAGKQSTDMHIGSYLGYLAGKFGKGCEVVIISRDTDFDKVLRFWKQKIGMHTARRAMINADPLSVSQQNVPKPKLKKKLHSEQKAMLNQEVMKAVSNAGFTASVANIVAKITSSLYGDQQMVSGVEAELKEQFSNYEEVYDVAKPVLLKYADEIQPEQKAASPSKEKPGVNEEMQKSLRKGGFSNDIIRYTSATVNKNRGTKNGKLQTYRSIISKYGQTKGLSIYTAIKKYL